MDSISYFSGCQYQYFIFSSLQKSAIEKNKMVLWQRVSSKAYTGKLNIKMVTFAFNQR